MLPRNWPADYAGAVAVQNRLRKRLVIRPLPPRVRLVAGVDVSYEKHGGLMHAGVVVMRLPRLQVLEARWASVEVAFPYIPGLLAFREAPAVMRVFKDLEQVPEAIIVDGQGIAHMRGFGLASHLGVLLGLPAVGCAKTRLVGEHAEVTPRRRGRRRPLFFEGGIVGSVLCTRDNTKPVYVSPGHLSDVPSSVRLVLRCCCGFRIPEPVRAAHVLANKVRLEHGSPRS